MHEILFHPANVPERVVEGLVIIVLININKNCLKCIEHIIIVCVVLQCSYIDSYNRYYTYRARGYLHYQIKYIWISLQMSPFSRLFELSKKNMLFGLLIQSPVISIRLKWKLCHLTCYLLFMYGIDQLCLRKVP